MKTAIYPGSFNPFHEGHLDVLNKGLRIFDCVHVMFGTNPEKQQPPRLNDTYLFLLENGFKNYSQNHNHFIMEDKISGKYIHLYYFNGLLKDNIPEKATAIIKGIRDTNDFLYEQKMQYWNEDLGITIPTVYIISDRELVHVSSSAIRSLEKFK